MQGSPTQPQRPSGISSSQSETSAAFQSPRHTTPVLQVCEDIESIAVRRACGVVITLLTTDVTQIGQRPGRAPPIPGFPKCRKRLLIEVASDRHLALLTRYVTLLIDRPRGPAAIAKLLKDTCGLTQGRLGCRIVTANSDYIGKIMKAPCGCQSVRERTPALDASFKIHLRRGVITAISCGDCQRIQRCTSAPSIAQFLIEKETLFEKMLRCRIIAQRRSQSAKENRDLSPFF